MPTTTMGTPAEHFHPITYVIKTPAPLLGAPGAAAAAVLCAKNQHPLRRLTVVPAVGNAPPTSAERDAVAPADALTFVTGVEKDQEKLGLLLGTLRVRAVRALTACAQCSATTGVDADAAGGSNARYTDGAPPPQVAPRPVWVCLQCESALCAACYEKKQMAAFAAWGASGGGGGGAKVPVLESTWRGPGARVCRGPTWDWGDQDGGEGGIGTITHDEWADWVTVTWDNGNTYSYRASEEEGGPDLFYC
jgi:hypothetical protein